MRKNIKPESFIIGMFSIVVLIGLLGIAITAKAADYHGSAYGAAVGVYGQQRNHDAYYYGMDRFNLGHQFARRGEYRFDQGCVDDHEEDTWTVDVDHPNPSHRGFMPHETSVTAHDIVCDKDGTWGHWD